MEEYVREAPQSGSVCSFNQIQEYQERDASSHDSNEHEPEPPPLISTDDDDLLGLRELNPQAAELEERNALALAIIPPGGENRSTTSNALTEFGTSGWELALVTAPSNINNSTPPSTKLAGGFDKLLLDSLYEDDSARRNLQMQNAGYGPYGMGADPAQVHNPFEVQQDPFFLSNNIAPPTNVQLAIQHQQQQMMMHQQQGLNSSMMMVPYQNTPNQYSQQQHMGMDPNNPFGDPFSVFPQNSTAQRGNHGLL